MAEAILSIAVGHKVSVTKTVTERDVVDFAKVSLDHNPVHMDAAYAAKTRFKQRVAHGIFSLALVSAALGTKLGGPNKTVIYLGQNATFLKPVFLGDTVTAQCEVTAIRPDRPILTVATVCTNQRGEVVTKGEATVLLDPLPYQP